MPSRPGGSYGEVPKRSNGADCKSAGLAFGGSNPPLSTIGLLRRGQHRPVEAATAEAGRWKAEENFWGREFRGVSTGYPAPVRQSPAAARGGVGSRAKLIRRIREADVTFESESAGIAQLARARAFQARGRGFESRFPLQSQDRWLRSAVARASVGFMAGRCPASRSQAEPENIACPRSSGGRARPW